VARIPASSLHVDSKPPSEFEIDDRGLEDELETLRGNIFNGESVEAVFRGKSPGIPLLVVTNSRLMFVDRSMFDDHTALVSVPLKGVSSVSVLVGEGESALTATTVGIAVLGGKHMMICAKPEEARQLHDLLIWSLIG
jgi:hypothetical protein